MEWWELAPVLRMDTGAYCQCPTKPTTLRPVGLAALPCYLISATERGREHNAHNWQGLEGLSPLL